MFCCVFSHAAVDTVHFFISTKLKVQKLRFLKKARFRADGLVNGTMEHVMTNNKNEVLTILILLTIRMLM